MLVCTIYYRKVFVMSKENTEEVVREIIEYANGEIKKVKETGDRVKNRKPVIGFVNSSKYETFYWLFSSI